MIIGVCGFIGSGKDTIADYLVNFHEFRRESFASTLTSPIVFCAEAKIAVKAINNVKICFFIIVNFNF